MKTSRLVLGILFTGICHLSAQPYGLSNRVANTTLQLPPSLGGYRSTNAFGTNTFVAPIAIVTPPGETDRIFIVEQNGRITLLSNLDQENPTRTVFLDIRSRVRFSGEAGLLGLAFHPQYSVNRYFYLFYVSNTNGSQTSGGDGTRHDRLSRFEVSASDPNQGLPDSELILFQQRDEASNHNGGDLHFGPDGYLYVSLGDEGGANDQFNNSQVIHRDFFAGVMRLDVDSRPESLMPNPHPANTSVPNGGINYRIPPDNPFVGVTSFNGTNYNASSIRTEFWAVGLRNPWRFSFDPATGFLWLADVGQGAREEVNIITKGGNYGWAYREGLIGGPKTPPAGFTHINPIQDYGRGSGTNQGASVTGGVVYRGTRLPELHGAYIFADYISDNLWQMRYEVNNGVTNITPFSFLFRETDIAAFGIDPRNGDVLMANVSGGTIRRLVGDFLPETLADVGAFSDLETLTPHPGIIPYDVNTPVWADGAQISRWFCVPSASGRFTFRANDRWTLPPSAVWFQHFEMEMTNGVPESRRRLETRILARDGSAGTGVYAATYRWTSATNAVLVGTNGMEETLTIYEGGIPRNQVWKYPSRADCLTCHNGNAGRALGFNTPQLNRDFNYNGIVDNQIRALNNVGYFVSTVANLHNLPRMAPLTDTTSSAEYRASSYLAANCAHCHYPLGPGIGNFDARIYPTFSAQRIIDGLLVDDLGNPSNRVVSPGSLALSVMHQRMASTAPNFRMPFIGSVVPDTQALSVFEDWIEDELQDFQSFPAWQISHFGATNAANGGAMDDFDGDGARNLLEYYTETDPKNAADAWRIGSARSGDNVEVVIPQIANRGFEVLWSTNLMTTNWRFLNVPENAPHFSASNRTHRVPDAVGPTPAYYRVRVFEH